jgi:tRNA pseudouridine55 synthase
VGSIEQIPPRVSAVKIDGRRAHDRARKGEDFEIKARSVEVYRFDISPLDPNRVSYVIECSPGTYVRSLARDLGAALGCGGTVESIRREASGGFNVGDAVPLEEASFDTLKDWTLLLPHVRSIRLPRGECESLLNGRQESLRSLRSHHELGALRSEDLISYGCEGGTEFLGLLKKNSAGEFVIQVNIERSVE